MIKSYPAPVKAYMYSLDRLVEMPLARPSHSGLTKLQLLPGEAFEYSG